MKNEDRIQKLKLKIKDLTRLEARSYRMAEKYSDRLDKAIELLEKLQSK